MSILEKQQRLSLIANRLGALSTALSDMISQSGPDELSSSGPDMAALNTVALWPGTRIDELATIIGLSHSGTVRLVDRLVGKGLIERRPHPDDQRAAALHPTDRGIMIANGFQEHRLARLKDLVQTLSPRQQDRLAEAIGDLLRLLAYDVMAADRICRYCDERICSPDICPTEHWVREQAARAARFGSPRTS
jgi:MarR family transcriptional regulator, negative regulator of the multidrug operon emrRAB